MSLLFYDGFDNYTYLPLKWDEFTQYSQFSIKSGIGRKNDNALCAFSDYTDISYDHIGKHLGTYQETIILGFAYKKVKTDYGYIEIDFNTGDTTQSKIRLFDTGIIWYKGDDSFNYGKEYVLKFNSWNYFEAKIKTHTTSGTVDIRVDEHSVIALSNISTATTTNYIDRVRFKSRHISNTYINYAYIDDLYIANVSGTVNNNFLGNCTVTSLSPTSQGEYSDFSLPSTISGVSNYSMINESVYTEDTTTYSGTFLEYASGDDGGYHGDSFYSTSTTTNFLVNSTTLNMGLFFRFSGINIPRGAKIITAKLQVYTVTRHTSSAYIHTFEMAFQKSGTPPNQITSISDFNSRVVTYARKTTYLYNEDPTTINNKDSLQELVNRDDWLEENNSVILKFYTISIPGGSSTSSERYNVRQYDYSNDPYSANSPRLYIEWQLPNGSSGTYVVADDINKKDSYGFTASGISDIFAVKHNFVAKRYLDRMRTDDLCLLPVITDGITTYSGGQKFYFKDTNYVCLSNINDLNPITDTSWTLSNLQDYDFGFMTTISG